MDFEGYTIQMWPLAKDEGGGWLITFPDLPGCMSDGESIEEAIRNGQDALGCYLAVTKKYGDALPKPGSASRTSGQFRLRAPKSLHARLAARARQEGVSMNTLAVALLAEGLGRRHGA
jgi:antitoxin HicB